MTKIDESKKYKFSEIIAMSENKELPEKTVIRRENKMYSDKTLKIESNVVNEVGLISMTEKVSIEATVTLLDINSFWSIKLPIEDKFYLKLPFSSNYPYLHCRYSDEKYEFYSTEVVGDWQCQFTQKEIDAMAFDMNFFVKVKVGESI